MGRFIRFLVLAVLAGSLSSCSLFLEETPSAKPRRTPMPVKECYGQLLDRRQEPAVLESLKGMEFWCEGPVSRVNRGSFQFHVKAVRLVDTVLQLKPPDDQYLDCQADAKAQLEYLHIGDHVVFKGKLDSAFPDRAKWMSFFGRSYKVKFAECLILPQGGAQKPKPR